MGILHKCFFRTAPPIRAPLCSIYNEKAPVLPPAG